MILFHTIIKPLLGHGTSNLKEQVVSGCTAPTHMMQLCTSLAGSPFSTANCKHSAQWFDEGYFGVHGNDCL
jgi:hypothetical protein